MNTNRPTVPVPYEPAVVDPAQEAALDEALSPGSFRTYCGFEMYRRFCLGLEPIETFENMGGRCG